MICWQKPLWHSTNDKQRRPAYSRDSEKSLPRFLLAVPRIGILPESADAVQWPICGLAE